MPDFDTLVIHAHPRPSHSRVVARLKQVFDTAEGVAVHPLYERYPDFDIDVAAEQQALSQARLLVWLAPVHWYGMPALLKHWVDQVLLHGWAYGHGGTALHGKTCWWVASAGAAAKAYAPGGAHRRPFEDFVPPIEQTARFCGMDWLPPFVVHGGHALSAEDLDRQAQALGEALARHRSAMRELAAAPGGTSSAPAGAAR